MIAPPSMIGTIAAAAVTLWWTFGVFTRHLARPRAVPAAHAASGRRRRNLPTAHIAWRHRQRRRPPADPADFAAWLESIARLARAGTSLRHAVVDAERAPGVSAAVAGLRRGLRLGLTLDAAVDRWMAGEPSVASRRRRRRARRPPRLEDPVVESIEAIGVVLLTVSRIGGAIAEPLDRTAIALRQRAADLGERRAQSAQALMSARVLAAVPVGVLGLLLVVDAGVRGVVSSPTGIAVVALGAGLDVAGFWWMHRIVRGAR